MQTLHPGSFLFGRGERYKKPAGVRPFRSVCRATPDGGFTLMELIVVLILFGVAAAVVMPSFTSGLKGLELETAGRNLITQMKHARSEAIAKQRVFRVLLQDDKYAFTNDFGEVIKAFPLPDGISIAAESELPITVSFYANGRSTGLTFALQNEAGKKIAIFVDPITGFAFVRNTGGTK